MAIGVFSILFRSGNYILFDDFSKSEAAKAETLTTLVLKHRETRYDIPRGYMIFIVKIILNLLCLVMTFA